MFKRLSQSNKRLLLLLGRFALAAIFIFYAYAKMKPLPGLHWSIASVNSSLLMFSFNVGGYNMLPDSAVIPFAKVLPPFEMLLGLWLLSGVGLRFSSLCAAALLAVFIFAMTWVYVHGLVIPCGCGGAGDSQQVGPLKIFEDVLMLALSVAVAIGAFKAHSNRLSQSFNSTSEM